ncbi:DUF29 domain-containing protein [uncultured Sphingomonas sp.]|uniref:DUF29 domain-containing protein n=1 Tax=uncultured Sphingomonas sp. TaxID=158754 RepID=UPI0035CA8B10
MAERDPSELRRNYPAYEEDFAAWLGAQAALLRARRFDELDIEHLVDEVESVGRSEFRAFASSIELIIFHMLKWDFQPELRGTSWRKSIRDQRRSAAKLLVDNPSFKLRIVEAVELAYIGMPEAVNDETGVPAYRLPQSCPYSWDEIMNRLHDLNPDRPWPN